MKFDIIHIGFPMPGTGNIYTSGCCERMVEDFNARGRAAPGYVGFEDMVNQNLGAMTHVVVGLEIMDGRVVAEIFFLDNDRGRAIEEEFVGGANSSCRLAPCCEAVVSQGADGGVLVDRAEFKGVCVVEGRDLGLIETPLINHARAWNFPAT